MFFTHDKQKLVYCKVAHKKSQFYPGKAGNAVDVSLSKAYEKFIPDLGSNFGTLTVLRHSRIKLWSLDPTKVRWKKE